MGYADRERREPRDAREALVNAAAQLTSAAAVHGRVPPHDLEAERAVLGSILLDNSAMSTVEAMVGAADFYHPAHGVIYESVQALSGRREPIDVVTLAAELRARERLNTVGGAQYIGELTDTIPTIAHVESHARIVSDLAGVRRMIEVAHEIVARGYGEHGSAEAFMDFAAAKVFEVAQKRSKSTLVPLEQAIIEAFARIESVLERGLKITGTETGFRDLDQLTAGMHPGQLIIIAARPAMGKCLAADSEIVLEDGSLATIESVVRAREARLLTLRDDWTLGMTSPSDFVDDGVKPVFRVTTRLGRTVTTTLTHPFLTARGWRPLAEIGVGERVAVPRRIPVFGERSWRESEGGDGLTGWLEALERGSGGSGTTRRPGGGADGPRPSGSARDRSGRQRAGLRYDERPRDRRDELLTGVPSVAAGSLTVAVRSSHRQARALGQDAGMSVPAEAFTLRREYLSLFLNRLFAVNGSAAVLPSGQARIRFTTASERFARQVQHLLLRFDVVASLQRLRAADGGALVRWQLDITHADSLRSFIDAIGIVGQERPLARVEEALKDTALAQIADSDVWWDEVVSIEALGPRQVYDLTVPGTHNFVANDVCVHNTSLVMNLTEHAASSSGKPVLFFSLEMPRVELANRLMCAEARVDQSRLRTSLLTQDDVTALTAAANKLHNLPIYIDDSGDLTLLELRAKARRMKSERDLSLIVIDYLQLMKSTRDKVESREREISEISRGLKSLAKELEVPIIALSQLNRACETRPGKDKRPMLADLRESGAIEQDADVVMFIYRDEIYNRDTEDKGIAELIIAKQRNGPTDVVRLRFIRELTKFENLAMDEHSYGDANVGGFDEALMGENPPPGDEYGGEIEG